MTAISARAKTRIGLKLRQLAKKENTRILLAIESGSRAWGFPSTDSDYDVRFIYARRKNDYLSVRETRDVIETKQLHDKVLKTVFDLNGWDIRKSLQLILKQNAVVHEWLVSPVVYSSNREFRDDLLTLIKTNFDPAAFIYHYDRLAQNSFAKISEKKKTARLKHYCYALRATLSVRWIEIYKSPPPMDVESLLAQKKLDSSFVKEFEGLILQKSSSTESDEIARSRKLDDFIQGMIDRDRAKPSRAGYSDKVLKKADTILRKFLT